MKKLLLKLLLILTVVTTGITAQEKPQAVIIFDASGSMWGQIDGKAKISIAKDALKSVVKKWNPDVDLGLTAYGHRKKGDCNDIETLVPVGAIDKDRIISLVKKIQPKGKTPIARSLKKVAEELKFTEEKATIILISDGKESCDANPCDVAKDLEKKGIDFVTHVIGFNVDKKTDEQLECIADATGGEYFSAKNATALNDAMKRIVKKVEKVEPTPKKLTHNLEISASEKEGGKWVRASHWIYPIVDGEKGSSISSPDSTKEKAKEVKLPIGKYIIESKYNEFTKETPFEIKAGEVTKLNIIMGQTGKVEISASEKEGGKWVRASHWIYPIVDGEKGSSIASPDSTKEKAKEVKLPIGKYIIESKYNKFTKETPFEVKAGEVTKLHINFAPFHVTIKGINQCSIVNHEVISPKGRMVTQSQAPANKGADFVLPNGTYYIESTANEVTKKNKITIGGEDATKGVTVDFGGEDMKGSVEGAWKTSEGRAEIRLDSTKVQGNYSSDNGEIIGEMTYPQKFEGFWIEDGSNVKCSTAKNGRYHWGRLVWEFEDDMCSFKGKWGYCNKKPDSSWNGTFIKSLPKEPTKEELIKADTQEPTPQKSENKTTAPAVEDKTEEIHQTSKIETKEENVADAMKQIGAMLGGAQKSIESKPLKAYKESITVALPFMEKTKVCYSEAKSLDDAKKCDDIANEGSLMAQKKMTEIMGVSGDKLTPIDQKEWNDELREKKVKKEIKDLKEAKLTITCIDKGASAKEIQKCVKNNGEFVHQKSELEQLGGLLEMFGGKK